ncbi:MAG TPA: hypothetical protein VF132_02365 [Rudaea sp.]
MRRHLLALSVIAATVLLPGCDTKSDKDLLQTTLETYAATIRWGNFDDAAGFVDPETLKEHPITPLDIARYRQVRVTAYNEQPYRPVNDTEVRQVVEIGIVNNNTQVMRSLVDRQLWRYDAKAKRWWLVSGLPDITQH